MHYIPDTVLVARHAFAPSYYGPWTVSKVVPYNSSVQFSDGRTVEFHKRERPHLVFDKSGDPSHLVTGVVAPGKNEHGYQGLSYTLVQPIAPKSVGGKAGTLDEQATAAVPAARLLADASAGASAVLASSGASSSDAEAPCRDAFLQPFAPASIWNTAIGSGAQYSQAHIYNESSGDRGPCASLPHVLLPEAASLTFVPPHPQARQLSQRPGLDRPRQRLRPSDAVDQRCWAVPGPVHSQAERGAAGAAADPVSGGPRDRLHWE